VTHGKEKKPLFQWIEPSAPNAPGPKRAECVEMFRQAGDRGIRPLEWIRRTGMNKADTLWMLRRRVEQGLLTRAVVYDGKKYRATWFYRKPPQLQIVSRGKPPLATPPPTQPSTKPAA
jgi:hypothetical protein